MPITIGRLGIIKGGVCEKRFAAKKKRERGSEMAMQYLIDHNCITTKKGWSQIVRMPDCVTNWRWVIDNICHLWGGDVEVGWWRFMSDIAKPLKDSNKKFRMSHLKQWAVYMARSEWSMGGTILSKTFCYNQGAEPTNEVVIGDRITMVSPKKLRERRPIRQEGLYEEWKQGKN